MTAPSKVLVIGGGLGGRRQGGRFLLGSRRHLVPIGAAEGLTEGVDRHEISPLTALLTD